ncbi:MAG: hypothetical protein L0H78_12025 [Humibacillus sp.]|nr:hypothetical protein [Humibacillus sp.]
MAQQLAEQGAPRADTILDQTTDRRWMLCSFEAFDLPYTGRGLPVEDAAGALVTVLPAPNY